MVEGLGVRVRRMAINDFLSLCKTYPCQNPALGDECLPQPPYTRVDR